MISLGPPVALLSLAFASSSGLFSGTCVQQFELELEEVGLKREQARKKEFTRSLSAGKKKSVTR